LSIDDARSKIEAWRTDYSLRRPHSSLGHLIPNEYVQNKRQEIGLKEKSADSTFGTP
jgi:putative transposase